MTAAIAFVGGDIDVFGIAAESIDVGMAYNAAFGEVK